ncbi:ROK family protein [uncultured Aliiroseovarius sp.]|uniref:ROK family protein n=1 Tax=uncultured Aliiroseovarius sp. TaxID=1658783 RepID=UPI002598DBFB|nr:ROK family protein [uncultured Aliiroseovarius sp.]
MSHAAGIDLGGTKIEVQVFDADWRVIGRNRVPTPANYDALIAALAGQVQWADDMAGGVVPVGIGAAGLLNPATGRVLSANLAASGQPLPRDIAAAVGREITFLNDARAMALSEAVFGVGRGLGRVASVILGTGIGGGVVLDGVLLHGPTLTGGEFGHIAAPAHLVARHGLPILPCGCGRAGCIESFIAGPGLARLAHALTGEALDPRDISARRRGDMAPVWALWCDLTAELLHMLTLTLDPDLIVLGGGLSRIGGVIDDLSAASARAQFGDFRSTPLASAEGGDSSGARGAAYAAWQAQAGRAHV